MLNVILISLKCACVCVGVCVCAYVCIYACVCVHVCVRACVCFLFSVCAGGGGGGVRACVEDYIFGLK